MTERVALAAAEDAGVTKGRMEGHAEGEAVGKQNAMLVVAANALRQGLSAEVIREFTGLSADDIRALAARGLDGQP